MSDELVKARALVHLRVLGAGNVGMIPRVYVDRGMAELVDGQPAAAPPKKGAKGSIVEADLVKADEPVEG